MTFTHHLLALVPGRSTATIRLRAGSAAHVVTGTPSAATLGARLCTDDPGGPGLVGLARTGAGVAIPGTTVTVRWVARVGAQVVRQETLSTTSDGQGRWAICTLSAGEESVTVSEMDGRRTLASLEVLVPERGF